MDLAATMKLVRMAAANFPLRAEFVDVPDVAELWYQAFRIRDPELMETALRLALMTAKNFPTIADLNDAIKELEREDKPPQEVFDKRASREFVQRVTEAYRYGRHVIDITDVRDYARRLFEDISDDLIRRNYNELATAQKNEKKCFGCQSKRDCVTNGHRFELYLHSAGYMTYTMVPCGKGA